MTTSIARALEGKAQTFDSVDAFWRWHVERNAGLLLPVDRAIVGGASADRLGYAFVAGYSAALHALFPDFSPRTLASLAATEDQGANPKFIKTSLVAEGQGFRLNGKKSWVTLGGEEMLVLANAGEAPDGRALLRLVRIDRARAGVVVTPLPQTPFIPEVSHAEVRFENVAVKKSEVLERDGWNNWVKPFRTVEDIHVHAAVAAHLLSQSGQFGWPDSLRERLLSVLVALRSLASEDPSSPVVHLSLAGVMDQTRAVIAELDWSKAPDAVRERWERDSPLLKVAGKAREARRAKAWDLIGG